MHSDFRLSAKSYTIYSVFGGFSCLRMSSVVQREQDLVGGYIKEQCLSNKDFAYPLDLNKVVIDFLGNIFVKFDVGHFREFVKEDGKLIEIGQDFGRSSRAFLGFGSKFCMEKDVTIIDIECIRPNTDYNVIGILTDLGDIKVGEWIGSIDGCKYWWYNNAAIYGEKDNRSIAAPKRHVPVWQAGDIITLRIDLIAGKVTFYWNKEEIHKMKLQRRFKYYFVMMVSRNSSYRIV